MKAFESQLRRLQRWERQLSDGLLTRGCVCSYWADLEEASNFEGQILDIKIISHCESSKERALWSAGVAELEWGVEEGLTEDDFKLRGNQLEIP